MWVTDSSGIEEQGVHFETWFFNPAISMDVDTTDHQSIKFEEGGPGDWVHSVNHIKIKNNSTGGVNLWVYIAGTDIYGINGAAKCPTTNKIDIENYMWFRGWSGTLKAPWTQMSEYDENEGCEDRCTYYEGTCYGAVGLPQSGDPLNNVLTNNGLMEVEFKIQYPVPCIGDFNNGEILIFGKSI
jgi:hypothetical protein